GTVRAGPQTDPPLLERLGPWRCLALAGNDFRTRNVFVPGIVTAHRFNVLVCLFIGKGTFDLRPVSRDLVVDLDAILRQRAGLTVHLDRASLSVVVERLDELGLIPAPQHPHAPRPVEEDRFQVFGSIRWRKRRPSTASASSSLALRRS